MTAIGRVTVCGLGPGGSGQITEATASMLDSGLPVYLRTSRHPSASRAVGAESFDHIYEAGESFDQIYQTIADALAEAARSTGHVVYAVPGSPLILERSVRRLFDVDDIELSLIHI